MRTKLTINARGVAADHPSTCDRERRQLLQLALGAPLLGAAGCSTWAGDKRGAGALLTADVAINVHSLVGESPVWDEQRQRLLWLDQATGSIYQAQLNRWGRWHETRRWELQRPIAAIVLRRGGGFVIAAGSKILRFDEASGQTSGFATLIGLPDGVRMNEAKCDPQGRIWATTLATDFTSLTGGLYRIDPDGRGVVAYLGLRVGNGMDWSTDGKTFYFVDSLTQSVDAFDFDAAGGTIDRRRSVVKFQQCAPDGLVVDQEDCLWIAAAAAGEVRRYTRTGQLLARVKIGTPGVTSCAFGGDGNKTLFITSLGIRMPEIPELGIPSEQLENNLADSGAMFVCRPGASGMTTRRFAG